MTISYLAQQHRQQDLVLIITVGILSGVTTTVAELLFPA
jgi:hypothetical protein